MKRLKIAHLNDDFAVGGVTKSLDALTAGFGAELGDHRIIPVDVRGQPPCIDADVIVTHFPPSWRWLSFTWRLRRANPQARLIHVEHSYTREWERLMVRAPRRFRLMMRLAFRIPDQIIAVSQGQADWLREVAPAAARRTRVIHPWSGRQQLETVPLPTPRPRLVVGAYGRLTYAKGMDVLIAAAATLDTGRFKIQIGGFGPEEAALKRDAGALTNVSFFGRVTDVRDFLAGCDIVVVPSRWEAFGQVAAEAKMAGRPVIVADVDGLPEQVGDAGLVWQPAGPQSLAHAIERLGATDLAMLGARARMSLAAVEWERFWQWRSALNFEPSPRLGDLTDAGQAVDCDPRSRSATILAR